MSLTCPIYVGTLLNTSHDILSRPFKHVPMITTCEYCEHKLWAEVREVASIRFVLYFDDDERSETYAGHVTECPNCGPSLLGDAIKPIHLSHHLK